MELTCLECEKNAYMLIFMWTGYVMTSDSDKNKFINSSSLLVWVPFSHFKAKKNACMRHSRELIGSRVAYIYRRWWNEAPFELSAENTWKNWNDIPIQKKLS